MYSVWKNYMFIIIIIIIIIILLLATSFGLKRPSSGQYLQKIKILQDVAQKSQLHGIPFTFSSGL